MPEFLGHRIVYVNRMILLLFPGVRPLRQVFVIFASILPYFHCIHSMTASRILLTALWLTAGSFDHDRISYIDAPADIGYDLSAPDEVFELPPELDEISGIAVKDAGQILCVQDEREIIFVYDIRMKRVTGKLDYGYSGDYEDIAGAGGTVYMLRSDGVLSEIDNYESPGFSRQTYATGIPWKENEGLCYDGKNNRLLIAPKETPGKDALQKRSRYIYGFDLVSKRLAAEPAYRFSLSDIEAFAAAFDVRTPMKGDGRDKKPDISMQISAIAIHPITGDLFVLSGPDRLLYVFRADGSIVYLERLDKDVLGQPEGIAFLASGDMLISSEGGKKPARLAFFRYTP